jgi:hypothetical protein
VARVERHFFQDLLETGSLLVSMAASWADMPAYDGYLEHVVLVDEDDPGHPLLVSQWATRAQAGALLREYSSHPNARIADRLVSAPRRAVAHRSRKDQA